MKKIGIILVVTNEKHNLKMLFNSLINQSYKNYKIYFVDNKSSDGSVEYFEMLNKNEIIKVKYIFLNENTGFAKGNNIGAEAAISDECDYVFVLNNDTELDDYCLEELVKLAESDNKIGIVGPVFFYWNRDKIKNTIQLYGAKVNFKNQKSQLIGSGKSFEEIDLPEVLEVDYVGGGTTFCKKEVIQRVGLFEEMYFIYNDEIDLAYRVKNAGYKTFVSSKAKAWHNHNWSKKNKNGYYFMYYYMMRNRYLYFIKHRFFLNMLINLIWQSISFPVKIKWFSKVAGIKVLKFYYLGIWHGLLNKKGRTEIEIS